MMQPAQADKTDFFTRIAHGLETAGRLTEAVLEYVDAALFPVEAHRLANFLSHEAATSEWDSLLDLIFYPDHDLQMALEPLLHAAPYTPGDEADLRERLLARPVEARIRMPDDGLLARILVPEEIKCRYLERLNITWRMDPRVAAAMDKGGAAASAGATGVYLRNARFRFTAHRRNVLCRFFECLPDTTPDHADCLDLVIALLEETGENVDFYDQLIAHKRFLFRSLRQAKRFEALLRRSNMETLMLQGLRAPHAPGDELRRHMRLLDRICLAMFGHTETVDAPTEEPLRIVSDLETPGATVRSLLR